MTKVFVSLEGSTYVATRKTNGASAGDNFPPGQRRGRSPAVPGDDKVPFPE